MKRLRYYLLAILMATGNAVLFMPVEDAAAVSGACYFTTKAGPVRGTGTCSVPGLGDYGTHDVLTGRNGNGTGNAIPLSVNTKNEFINFMRNRFNNGGAHDKVGSAFIIQEMRGDRRWPSGADINDWVDRMRNEDVTVRSVWDGNVGRTSWYDPGKRNTFYAPHPPVGRQVINVYDNGRRIAQIEHACGNMVAGTITLPRPFDLEPDSRVNRTTASPGYTIRWTHTVRNVGGGPTTRAGHHAVDTGSTPGRTRSPNHNADFASNRPPGWSKTVVQEYVVRQGDIGERFCQRFNIRPNNSYDFGTQSSAFACVRIVEDFELTPKLDGPRDDNVPVNEEVDDVDAIVDKTGRAETDRADWVFGRLIVPPGVSIPGAGGVTQSQESSQQRYRGNGRTWRQIEDGSRIFRNSSTRVARDSGYRIPGGLENGTRVCWTLAVSPPNGLYTGWRYARPLCITVRPQPLKPTTQLWGFDARIGGKIVTSTARISNRTYGSWGEYGALSGGRNIGFGSASGLNNGVPGTTQSSWSKLTFANAAQSDCSGPYGCHGFVGYPDAMVQALRSRCESSGTTVTQGVLNDHNIICVDGTANITGNIDNPGGNTNNPGNLRQFVIIADDIIIDEDVRNVDAWLIAVPREDPVTGEEVGGRISTCSAVRAGGSYFPSFESISSLSEATCPQRLTVTGPVVANGLYLFRTTDPNKEGRPAEIFNLRADAFLWAYAGGITGADPVAQTTSLREIPPRF